MNLDHIFRLLGLVGVLSFITSAFTPLPNFLSRWSGSLSQVKPSDAVVVLGSALQPNGTLNNSSLRRTLHGIRLYQEGFAPVLVFLGSDSAEGFVEAKLRAELARGLGISADVILTEDGAQTTREEATRVKRLLWPRGVRQILLVTDSHHMNRAKRLFELTGFEVLAASIDVLSSRVDTPDERLKLTGWMVQEFLARFYYRAMGYM